MAAIKLTKTELRTQQLKLGQLQKYLPTLQLKKALLQMEVLQITAEIEHLEKEKEILERAVEDFSSLLSDKGAYDLFSSVKIQEIKTVSENIAGIDIPLLKEVVFQKPMYALFDTPLWLESAIRGVQLLIISQEKIKLAKEKKRILQKELREVSIRVNLFEKILIPRAMENIKRIRIFLGDQQLAAVCQAKVSKNKILLRQIEEEIII